MSACHRAGSYNGAGKQGTECLAKPQSRGTLLNALGLGVLHEETFQLRFQD